jgi:predicted enzyme related to lactoylglutathione lyase
MQNTKELQKSWTTWFEIPVSNFKRAREFYQSIFEIEIEELDYGPLKMGIFPHSDVGCALCLHPDFYQPSDNGPLVYMNANPDLQIVQNRIESAGGRIIMQKKQISEEHGFMCLFIDTEGNRLAIHSST